MENKSVLLTGVTGFLGSHTTIQLLERGYLVTGTLRKKERSDSIKKIIGKHTDKVDHLTLIEAFKRQRYLARTYKGQRLCSAYRFSISESIA